MLALKYADKHQHYNIAQQLCKKLVDDYFLHNDIDSVLKYDYLYNKYTDLIELEYHTELKFCDIIFKYERGEFDGLEIIRGLHFIEEKLAFGSAKYHYYYHSFQLMISLVGEDEEKLQNAITYFENLNINYNVYLSSFVIKLVYQYKGNENYKEAHSSINGHLRKCKEGSTVWFKYVKTACLLYFSAGEMKKANDSIDMAIGSQKFQDLSDNDKIEWHRLRNAK